MAYLHTDVYDDGLNQITTLTETLYLLNADPELTWATVVSAAIGHRVAPSISIPVDRVSGGGREVIVAAITDGTVSATGTATHWAVTDDSATKVLASGLLDNSQLLTDGNTFTLNAISIGIPGPVAA
jgi:hypothetical protein